MNFLPFHKNVLAGFPTAFPEKPTDLSIEKMHQDKERELFSEPIGSEYNLVHIASFARGPNGIIYRGKRMPRFNSHLAGFGDFGRLLLANDHH